MSQRKHIHYRAAWASLLGAIVLLAGCVADPPPPAVMGEERQSNEHAGRSPGGLVLAVDSLDEGFNPHLLADQGADTDLVATLMLPSPFQMGSNGVLQLNESLIDYAAPVPGNPRVVRYRIQEQAQWSDSVPVAAEDFEYLWQQMLTQPGVVDPAGYEHITAVRAGEGGKVVDVEFDQPFPQWRELFTHLLPAHLLKDDPDGFQGGLRKLPPLSAGPFMTRSADFGRGEIEFVRNDRYWDTPALIDQLVMRRTTGPAILGGMLRSGPGVVALVADTAINADVVRNATGFGLTRTTADAQLELTFSTTGPFGSDEAVRRAAAAAVNPDIIARIVSGETEPETTMFPFPDSNSTPQTARPGDVFSLLTTAGYTRSSQWIRESRPLTLTIGVDPASDTAVAAAHSVADQLRTAGFGARVWELDTTELYADALPHGLVDAVVGWQRINGDPHIAAESRFACPAGGGRDNDNELDRVRRTATTVPTLTPPRPLPAEASSSSDDENEKVAKPGPTPKRVGDPDAPARGSNVSGVCDPELDALLGVVSAGDGLAAANAGAGSGDLAQAGALIGDLAVRIPLVRPTQLWAVNTSDAIVVEPRGGTAYKATSDVLATITTWRRLE